MFLKKPRKVNISQLIFKEKAKIMEKKLILKKLKYIDFDVFGDLFKKKI